VAEQSRAQAVQVVTALTHSSAEAEQRLVRELDHVPPLVEQVIEQAKRRVIQGETVPASEKVVSLFEPHTQIIKRAEAGEAG
jgi:IS5 family transposase